MSEELQQFVCKLVSRILRRLQGTGLSPNGRYFSVAWPRDFYDTRCIQVPVHGASRWTPILADSDDCATFAYISNACLQSAGIKCRGQPEPSWQGEIFQLETAVICPENKGRFTVQHEKAYCFHKLDDLFWVKAQRLDENAQVMLVRLSSMESLPRNMGRRLAVLEEWNRKKRLQEKNCSSISDRVSQFKPVFLAG
jgi:hypothetical protein